MRILYLSFTALAALGAAACPRGGAPAAVTPTTEPTAMQEDKDRQPPATQPRPEAVPAPAPAPAEQFRASCGKNLESARGLLGNIKAVQGERTIDNTLVPYNHLAVHLDNAAARAHLYSSVHPDEAMRAAGEECEKQVVALSTEISLDRGLFEAVKGLDAARLDDGARRLRERLLRDFRRAGVDKDEPTRKRLKELADREVDLGQTYERNVRDDVRSIKVDAAALEGLPDDWRQSHKPAADGKITVTTDYPDYVPFRTYAKDAAARLELFKVYHQRGWPKNEPILKDLLQVRRERAKLLGYKTFADYVTEDKMSKSATAVRQFIDKVARAADRRMKRDYKQLLARRKKDDPKAKQVLEADVLYYEELVKREGFKIDAQEVRPYFEYTATRDGLLTVTSKLFGVEYRPATDAEVWHPSVDAYDVYQDGARIGRIYLDMHPREGKHKHAAQFTVVSGVAGEQLPEGALVCNFPDPRVTSPALLEHSEVTTMFHEFGHLMHHILAGRQRWVQFSGVATEWDFVEAPSQLLEEWAWDPATLRLFARHVKTGEPIPEELVARMRAADEFGQGTFWRRQAFLAAVSLSYHMIDDPAKADLHKMLVDLQKKYSPYPYIEDTHLEANFGHLYGYTAMYYTYIWSLVISKDLYSEFQKHGMLDEATARRYRDTVLVPGGSRDAADLVKAFLGRPYRFDAFKKWLER